MFKGAEYDLFFGVRVLNKSDKKTFNPKISKPALFEGSWRFYNKVIQQRKDCLKPINMT